MNKTKFFGAILASGLLLAACGDDGGGGGSNEYSDAIAESIRADEDVPFSEEEIDCLSVEFVDAIGGPDAFEDAGVSPEDVAESNDLSTTDLELGEDEAEGIAGAFGECDISLTEAFLSDFGDEVPDEVRTCIEENIDDEVFADLFAQAIIAGDEGDEPPPELMESLTSCITG